MKFLYFWRLRLPIIFSLPDWFLFLLRTGTLLSVALCALLKSLHLWHDFLDKPFLWLWCSLLLFRFRILSLSLLLNYLWVVHRFRLNYVWTIKLLAYEWWNDLWYPNHDLLTWFCMLLLLRDDVYHGLVCYKRSPSWLHVRLVWVFLLAHWTVRRLLLVNTLLGLRPCVLNSLLYLTLIYQRQSAFFCILLLLFHVLKNILFSLKFIWLDYCLEVTYCLKLWLLLLDV